MKKVNQAPNYPVPHRPYVSVQHRFPVFLLSHAQLGFFFAVLSGGVGLVSLIAFTGNEAMILTGLLLIPFALAIFIFRNLSDVITLIWINEIFFGGTGHWLQFGPIPIRWLLLILIIIVGVLNMAMPRQCRDHASSTSRRLSLTTIALFFYGLAYPIWLVSYSVLLFDNPVWQALGDIDFLFALLAFFAVRRFVARNRLFFRGWVCGATIVLAILFLILAFAPHLLALSFAKAILVGAAEGRFGTMSFGTNRVAMLSQMLLLPGFYWGLLIALFAKRWSPKQLTGVILALLAISSFVLFYLRGPLVAIALISLLLVISLLRKSRTRASAIRMIVLMSVFVYAVVSLYQAFIPEGVLRFMLLRDGYRVLGESRTAQAQMFWYDILKQPWLGYGLGSILPGTGTRSSELQYLMIVYRIGAINMLLLLLPLAWLVLELRYSYLVAQFARFGAEARFTLAFLLATLTILIAGVTNPYLTAVYTPMFWIIYLAMKNVTLQKI